MLLLFITCKPHSFCVYKGRCFRPCSLSLLTSLTEASTLLPELPDLRLPSYFSFALACLGIAPMTFSLLTSLTELCSCLPSWHPVSAALQQVMGPGL